MALAIVWKNRLKPRLNSLASRLIAAASIWTLLGLLIGGIVLSGTFRRSAEDNFDASLRTDLDALIAAANEDRQGGVALQEQYLNARFNRVYSGLYYQINPTDNRLPGVQISPSLFDKTLALTDSAKSGEFTWGHAIGPENQRLRVLSRRISFDNHPGVARKYDLFVAGDLVDVDRQIDDFNGTLFWSFVVLGIGLIGAVFVQVRIGLQPLRRVTHALARIRDGQARRLEGNFPAEIQPLASELNSLIEHSAEVVGRARTHVSNLAHFLKTPLSVLTSEAEAQPGPLADAVKRHVGTMRRQVDHYLTRARAAGSLDVLGNRTPVKPVLDDLARVLMRIHRDAGVTISVECPANLSFRGERQDLEEIAGNLIDNACKWSHGQVAVKAISQGATLTLAVEDDGEGLSPEERAQVGQRGERLDESVPGSGLGLAIVQDIAKLYGGTLQLETADLGGLRAVLVLPAIASEVATTR